MGLDFLVGYMRLGYSTTICPLSVEEMHAKRQALLSHNTIITTSTNGQNQL